MGKTELVPGVDASHTGDLMRQGLRGYRTAQIGGAAVALLDIALLVLALKRRSRAILVTGGVALATGIACFLLTPARALDDTIFDINVILASSAAGCAPQAFPPSASLTTMTGASPTIRCSPAPA